MIMIINDERMVLGVGTIIEEVSASILTSSYFTLLKLITPFGRSCLNGVPSF